MSEAVLFFLFSTLWLPYFLLLSGVVRLFRFKRGKILVFISILMMMPAIVSSIFQANALPGNGLKGAFLLTVASILTTAIGAFLYVIAWFKSERVDGWGEAAAIPVASLICYYVIMGSTLF